MSTTSATSAAAINAGSESRGTLRSRLRTVPWLTVVPLAAVLAYADGFWVIAMRGAAGAIERTQGPAAMWLRESTIIYRGFRDFVGPYVAHCHNLAHEDHAMMFGWEITP